MRAAAHRIVRGVGALAVASAAGCRSGVPPSDTAARDIHALVATYDSAWAAKDTAVVGRLLAPAYAYFTSTGRLSGRARSLGFLTDTSYVLTRSHRSDVRVVVAGPVARVASRWEGTGRFQGQPVLDDQTCGQIWVWGQGRWLLFSEHCVNRPVTDSGPPASS